MPEHPYGWLSVLPPIVAIVLAIATRRAVLSLLAALVAGAVITTHGDLVRAAVETVSIHLWPTVSDPEKLLVSGFTILMGATIGIINRSGGMQGLVALVTPWARTRRRGQLVTWLLGLIIFFDDYANTVLLGSTLRPLCRRLRISREKLAYLVDSTAAPVAGLALVSTWVAVEVNYVQEGLNNLPVAEYRVADHGSPVRPAGPDRGGDEAGRRRPKAFDVFVQTIPYRFYVLWTLTFVPLVALLGRDFGPMLDAERRVLAAGDAAADQDTRTVDDPTFPDAATPARWANAAVPLALCLAVIVGLMVTTGRAALAQDGLTPTWSAIFGQADSSYALFVGSLVGLGTAAVLPAAQRLLDSADMLRAAAAGARVMLPAILILWTASALSRMTGSRPLPAATAAREDVSAHRGTDRGTSAATSYVPYRLYTGEFLTSLLGGHLAAWMLPTTVFVLASVVALATGTSYGTMGILLPMVIPLCYGILAMGNEPVRLDEPIFLASIGGVLAGAIFGDHCSPISDTTVLSSQATACNHVAHVWTQMPYALAVAAISILFGTLPIGLGWSVWLALPLGTAAMAVLLACLGTSAETPRKTRP